MAAYVVVKVEVSDPEPFKRYQQLASASVEKFGGKFLVRGGAMVDLEGSFAAPRMVVLEFASLDRATNWYHSDEYRKAIAARQGAATFTMVALEGLAPDFA